MTRRACRWAGVLVRRALLVGFGVLLGVVALEVILRLAGPLLRPELRGFDTLVAAGPEHAIRLLCVGDSHTFGLWVKPEESYPARLRVKLARSAHPFVIGNAGVPGMNSSQLRDVIADLVRKFQPDVVLVMVGVADVWNLAALRTQELQGWRYLLRGGSWWDRSRVVKLARLLRFNLQYGRRSGERPRDLTHASADRIPVAVTDDAHFEAPITDVRLIRRILRRDLALIVSAIQAQHATVILVTYATDGAVYSVPNEVYRTFAREIDVPLIDLAERLRAWSLPPRQAVAFFPDFHPRPGGYELIARELAKVLPVQLGFGREDSDTGPGTASEDP